MRKRSFLPDVIMLVLSGLYCLGGRTFFTACPAGEDGSWMSCHWAGEAVFAFALVLGVQSLLLLVFRARRTAAGIYLSMIPAGLAAALVPGNLISLCKMAEMRCHTAMRPFAMMGGLVIAAFALVFAVFYLITGRREEGTAAVEERSNDHETD